MTHRAARVVLGLALVVSVLPGRTAMAQLAGAGFGVGAPPSTAAGLYPSPAATSFANPFTNPYMNPYLNPYMTTVPMNKNDMMLYFMAAQQARGGLGSAARGGLRGARALPPAGRVEPARPRPNTRGPARFDDNPYFNDGRGRLAARYPAYGSVAVDADSGATVSPGLSPAPNEQAGRFFNRHPAYNRNNGR